MAKREIKVLICDLCGAQDTAPDATISRHVVRLDRLTVEAESCDPCWMQFDAVLAPLLKAGRRVAKVA